VGPEFDLTVQDRRVLESWVRAPSTPQQMAKRAGVILASVDGTSVRVMAQRFGISQMTVCQWREYRRPEIHLICDNYGTHKHPAVREWLARHPRFHIHLTPTSNSWLNLVERWFARITQEAIRRGTFHSVTALERAILRYTKTWNQNPKPFIWTKTATRIRRSIRHANQTSVTGLVTIEGSVDRRLERGRRLAGVVFDEVGELAPSDRGSRVPGGFVNPSAPFE